ncbi:6864_t:CDS:1, partial [Entrophospora sp. SA101]
NILKETVDIYKCCIEIVREEKFNDSSKEPWIAENRSPRNGI